MSIDTAIEEMIASALDDSDFVTGMTAEMYTDGEISDLRADMEGELGELQSRIEALEEKAAAAAEPNLIQELADSVEVKEEPRAVNQIDWIMPPNDMIAGYASSAELESYVRSCLDHPNQAPMVISMVLTTARNLIDKQLKKQLEAEA